MRTRTCKTCLLAAAMLFAVANGSAKADRFDLAQVLQGGNSCEHVIRLMLRHGVNNSNNSAATSFAQHSPLGPMVVPAAELGDLELIQVIQKEVVDPACGPKFCVVVRNNSTRDVCGFRITLVALLGRIHPMAPTAIVKVDKVCAGEAIEIPVQLPIEALSMGNRNGQVIGFQRLVIAIDSFDQFVESNEVNNIKVLARTAIPMAAVVQEAVVTPSVDVAPAATAPTAEAAPPLIDAPAVTAPAATAPVQTDDLKSAIDQLSNQQQAAQPADAPTL